MALATLGLSVLNETEEPLWLHQVRYRDGALLVGHQGRLLAANVILRSSRASELAIPPTGGTRHTSAARHTYDCPDVLAFVVIGVAITVMMEAMHRARRGCWKTCSPTSAAR